LITSEGTSTFTARVDPRSRARDGSRVRLSVDPERFHFFDPATSNAIYSKQPAGLAS
jgi:ABC-type sugar transport system ATPase subunit